MQTLNVNVLLDTSLNYGYSKESFMVADELDKVKISKGESWFIVENDPKTKRARASRKAIAFAESTFETFAGASVCLKQFMNWLQEVREIDMQKNVRME
ncbi:MAG: hypothetical protein IPP27_09610 [Bacteroidetes bacterium]|nr:hypothetical protein [Bacteroidota bacterium]MBK9412859.1 hypothetical protein [Bacteroidota bacterium]MBL0032406.1 hypothetical protein [Bacteroidota bacterium]MBP6658417.1 hypothetical protein [Bacteroidia bacterium]MBP9890255.1 hypothetical protein [Leptospiraceae bacterium]